MSDLHAIAGRFEVLFTPDGAVRIPHANIELVSREEIRTGSSGCRVSGTTSYRPVHPGTIQIEGDTASGRAYIAEFRAHARRAVRS